MSWRLSWFLGSDELDFFPTPTGPSMNFFVHQIEVAAGFLKCHGDFELALTAEPADHVDFPAHLAELFAATPLL